MKTSRRPLGQVRRAMLVTGLLATVSAALMAVLPLAAFMLIDAAAPQGSRDLALMIAAGVAVVVGIGALLDLTRETLMVRAAYRIDHVMGQRMIDIATSTGGSGRDLATRAEAVETLRDVFANGRIASAAELPAVVIGMVALFYIEPLIGITGSASVLAMLIVITLARLASRRSSDAGRTRRSEARDFLATLASNPRLLDEHSLSQGAAARWELLNRGHVANAYKSAWRLGAARALCRALAVSGVAAVLIHGSLLAIDGAISAGAAVAAAFIIQRALATLEQLAGHAGDFAAYRHALRVLNAAEASGSTAPARAKTQGGGALVLSRASVSFGTSAPDVLQQIDLVVAPGSIVAVVGGPGAGKSTLAQLAAGLVRPSTGRADVDGLSIALARQSADGGPIGFLSDDPRLVAGTIAQNIAGLRKGVEGAAIEAAIAAGVHPMIAALPEGYATDVGPDGRNVPLRVRRAIAVARALCGPRRFVVLDTPESGLDDAGLVRLERMIAHLKHSGVGALIATNEARLVRLADEVVLIGKGRIEAKMPAQRFIEAAAMRAAQPHAVQRYAA